MRYGEKGGEKVTEMLPLIALIAFGAGIVLYGIYEIIMRIRT